ncbi:nitroreductase family protein [Acetobacterium sp.]|uniref:nitroreductase family protein n=1 Tax=Acetobacterium sp. TaxID=1872094 RepID=UPI003593C953
MNINFPIEETVKKRYSVRNYNEQAIESDKQKAIESFIDSLENPFGPHIAFHTLDLKSGPTAQKLGTYGVIKGASHYIGTTITLEPMALEALGYEFEALVLYLADLGLGTCWLGGTFDRQSFSNAMQIEAGEIFPIITPFGYAADHKHFKEKAMRKLIKADQRKEWQQLFFTNDFQSPLMATAAGDLAFALEMVRLGPSASNKQPWRILITEGNCHFYEYQEPGYSKAFSYDIQRVDMGIAAAHFDFAMKERKIDGHFATSAQPKIDLPKHIEYVFSWIRE